MKSLLLALIVFQSTVFAGPAKPVCAHEIIVLPQSHIDTVTGGDRREMEAAYSQFKIARYILANPGLPVFPEGYAEDVDLKTFKKINPQATSVIGHNHATFNAGIPDTWDKLNLGQIRDLANDGADLTLLLLGLLPRIHKTVSDENQAEVDFEYAKEWAKAHPDKDLESDPEMHERFFIRRERDALTNINNYFKDNPRQTKAILIFGFKHDFTKHKDLFPPECIHYRQDVGRNQVQDNVALCQGSCNEGETEMPGGGCAPRDTCGLCYGHVGSSDQCSTGAKASQYYKSTAKPESNNPSIAN